MSRPCRSFRSSLERALEGRDMEGVRVLAWHEHLLGCAHCRALLEAEEALELVLDSLPEPRLPAALAARVLARLRAARAAEGQSAGELDRLLALDRAAPPPALAARVLAGLEDARRGLAPQPFASEQRLDRLLERWHEEPAPRGLARRVLERLADERRRPRRAPLQRLRRLSLALSLAAAASVLVGVGALLVLRSPATPRAHGELAELRPRAPEPPVDLLAHLDVLEEWEVLVDDDLALLLGTLDEEELALLELEGVAEAPDEEESGG